MKKLTYILIFIMLSTAAASAQDSPPTGRWMSEHGNGQIEIYRKGEKYFGKIVWLKVPDSNANRPLTDIHNPAEELRNRSIKGLEVIKNLEYRGDNTWDAGTVYDPKSGKTYSCKMTMEDSRTLTIRGYKGMSMIGKSAHWTRIN